jgi:hypothetical protein
MKNKKGYKKLIIYLDQFAVSNMIDAKEGDIWYDIKNNIEKYHKNGEIICPMSAEHVLETSQRDFQRASMQNDFYWKISDRYTFWNLSYMIAWQIYKLFKRNISDFYFLKYNPNWDLAEEKCYNFIHLLFKKEKEDKSFDCFNKSELNIVTKSKILNYDKYNKVAIQEILEQNYLLAFRQKISSIIENFDYINDSLKSNSERIDIDPTILCLIFRFQFSKDDFCDLRDEIDKFGAEQIDSLYIRNKLVSYLNVNGGNTSMNDIIDYNRIATGLPYSDILFCDKKFKRYVIELGLDKKYSAKVLSATDEDLEYFLRYILKAAE